MTFSIVPGDQGNIRISWTIELTPTKIAICKNINQWGAIGTASTIFTQISFVGMGLTLPEEGRQRSFLNKIFTLMFAVGVCTSIFSILRMSLLAYRFNKL